MTGPASNEVLKETLKLGADEAASNLLDSAGFKTAGRALGPTLGTIDGVIRAQELISQGFTPDAAIFQASSESVGSLLGAAGLGAANDGSV